MKKLMFVAALLMSLFCAGCGGKNAEVNAFVSETNQLTSEIVQKIKANPTAGALTKRRKYLTAKRLGCANNMTS